MTRKLRRYYGAQHLHFITCNCYRRLPILGTPERRDRFLNILEETHCRYRFVVHGYVGMPEHFHLLISEPEVGDPSVVMKVLKERFSKQVHASRGIATQTLSNLTETRIWQKRFYDFNVWSARKKREKLRYIRQNSVKRGEQALRAGNRRPRFRTTILATEANIYTVRLTAELLTNANVRYALTAQEQHKVPPKNRRYRRRESGKVTNGKIDCPDNYLCNRLWVLKKSVVGTVLGCRGPGVSSPSFVC